MILLQRDLNVTTVSLKNINPSNNLFVTVLEGSVAPVSAQLQFLKVVST